MNLSRCLYIGLLVVLVLSFSASAQTPVGTAFTYQGRLDDGGSPANGIYDLEFVLYDAATAGLQVGSTVPKEDVAVANGLFVVALDFGGDAFTGSARWLQIGVRPGASSEVFTPLASRQELTPSPNAIQTPWSGVSGKPAGFADDVDNDSGGDITGVTAGTGLAGGGTAGDVTLNLDTGTTDGRYVLKSGDTMTGTLTLSPISGVGLSTTADIDLLGRVMRGTTPFIHVNTSLYNMAIGENALISNTTGSANTAMGSSALSSNTTGYNNTATGVHALFLNTTGYYNTSTGRGALYYNGTGYYNTATGTNALYSNTTGYNNTAMGSGALLSNTIGNRNSATGAWALQLNTTGNYNVAMGYSALAFSTGSSNTAIGTQALGSNTSGAYNIAVGYGSGLNATTGNYNIYIGNQGVAAEGNAIRIGDSNQNSFFAAGISGVNVGSVPLVGVTGEGQLGTVAAGAGSALDADTVDGQHASEFMGATVDDWVNTTGDTMTGTLTLSPVSGVGLSTTADVNLQGRVMRGTTPFIHANTSLGIMAAGENALRSNTTGSYNTAMGGDALFYNTTGDANTAMGRGALSYNTTGYSNTATGFQALTYNTAGRSNTATGIYALYSNTEGYENTATGSNALYSNTTGIRNTATGSNALYYNTTGIDNTATGVDALQANNTGYYNTATGRSALTYNTTGYHNTAMGTSALLSNTEGYENTAIGLNALYSNTTGSGNIAVGAAAGYWTTTGNDNIYIGNPGVADEGNTIRIGDSNQTRFFAAGIYSASISTAQVFVDSNGQLGINTSSRAFKDDIRDMAEATEGLLRLRPVSFRYKEADPSGDHPLQYGLIAEEVAEVYPELVVYSESGEPRSVQYHLLSSMLLNELQKLYREVQELRALKDKVGELTTRLAQLESR